MSRRLALLALALSCASGIAVLESPPVRGAQPADKVVRVGFVGTESPTSRRGVSALWERLRELGWVEGQNLVAERRWAEGRLDRLPTLMAEVVGRNIDVLVTYSTPGAVAAKNATSTVPIVAATMGDPVGSGLAASLAHPGGNLTGLSVGWDDVQGKWLELLQETVPRLSTVAVIGDPASPMSRGTAKQLKAIAPTRGIEVRFIEVREPEALDRAFQRARREAQAVLVLADPLTLQHQRQITALAARYQLPGMYTFLEYMDSGGLMAYSADNAASFRRLAEYVDKILRGARPGDLPIEQPTQYKLIVNLKTAEALRLKLPQSILLRADEVIR